MDNPEVVVGVDGPEPASAALTFACVETDRLGTTVIAVRAWQTALQTLTDALTACRRQHPDVPVDERLLEAHPVGRPCSKPPPNPQ